jgi:hypothetical protein
MGNPTDQHAWYAACLREREAWQRASQALPGSPDYDAEAWTSWRDSVNKANEAMYVAFGIPVTHAVPQS